MAVVSTFMCRPWSFLLPFPAPPIRTVLFGIDFASKVVCQRALLSPVGSVKRFKMQRMGGGNTYNLRDGVYCKGEALVKVSFAANGTVNIGVVDVNLASNDNAYPFNVEGYQYV